MKKYLNTCPDETGAVGWIGGSPGLPEQVAVPACTLCQSAQTFFFRINFPSENCWRGNSLAVFACTSCVDEQFFIPEMLQGQLSGADAPTDFLLNYQRNFATIVFATVRGLPAEPEGPLIHKPLCLTHGRKGAFGRMGEPQWVLEDETPGRVAGTEPVFLFQINQESVFEKHPDARPQIKLNLAGKPAPSSHPFYKLFLSNAVYFFGPTTASSAVYVLTQVD